MKPLLIGLLCLCLAWPLPASSTLLFDGADDKVVTTNVTGYPTGYPFTFGAVVRINDLNGFNTLISCGLISVPNGFEVYLDRSSLTNGTVRLYNPATSGDIGTTGTVPLTTWVFVGVSSASATSHRFVVYNYESNSVTLNETSTGNLGSITAPGTRCQIGSTEGPSSSFFDFLSGSMTWIAAYAGLDFTIASGAGLLNLAILGPYAGATPTMLYTFNEMAGTSATERRGTGNTGTLTNFPGSPWQPMSLPGPVTW